MPIALTISLLLLDTYPHGVVAQLACVVNRCFCLILGLEFKHYRSSGVLLSISRSLTFAKAID